jgi:hypothetical protein
MMKRIEWPGIATAVGILLIAAIAIDLSKWQPLLAALIALAGGALAYRGAMAKIYADEDRDRRDFERKRLGVYLRAEHVFDLLERRAGVLEEKTRARELRKTTVTLNELKITSLPDLDEAWANLELFPRHLAFKISQIRSSVTTLDNFIKLLPRDAKWEIDPTVPYPKEMKVTNAVTGTLALGCRDILGDIRPLIESMAHVNKVT